MTLQNLGIKSRPANGKKPRIKPKPNKIMIATKSFSIVAKSGTKQFILSPSVIENTIGKFFGIEWEKVNGNLRLANGHVLHFEDKGGKTVKNSSAAHYMVISDNNNRSSSNPQGIVKVALDRVNYFRDAGNVIGFSYMKGRRHNPIKAIGAVR